jgi:hypothetical protein
MNPSYYDVMGAACIQAAVGASDDVTKPAVYSQGKIT